MKNLLLVVACGLLSHTVWAQPTAGRIQYEVAQKTDHSRMSIIINGQMVKPGSPDFPTDLPDTRTFGMTLSFAGGYAKEERENNAVRIVSDGPGGGVSQMTKLDRPFEEVTYVKLADGTASTVVAVKKDGVSTLYRAELPVGHPAEWKDTDQTKKIAGYACHKATVPFKGETYTVWYTTDLPFTYSPVRELTPTKGVVLALEGTTEQYRASKVDAKAAVTAADVQPAAQAQVVTAAELKDLREKARADFRQRMVDEVRPGRN